MRSCRQLYISQAEIKISMEKQQERKKGRQEGNACILRQEVVVVMVGGGQQQGSGGYLLLLHFQMSCPANSPSVGINTRYFLLSNQ